MAGQQSSPASEPKLTQLGLSGFRSLESQSLTLGDINVLIGPNGSGKSNLIGFCRMLSYMVSSERGLPTFVGLAGGASALLHDGPKRTPQMTAHLHIGTERGLNEYRFRLGYAADDTLIFLEEQCRFSPADRAAPNPRWIDLGAGHRTPQLLRAPQGTAQRTQKTILHLLRRLQVYHFHDTSNEALVKQLWSVDDNRYLRGDAGNLAPFLLNLRERYAPYYFGIVDAVRLVAPFFDDFVLEPEHGKLLLRWREIGSDLVFGPRQISDGTLRAIALITLLLQPPETMPSMLVIDEPELGLHPFAVRIIAGLIKSASVSRQCIVATQSPAFLDEFDAGDVVVVDRQGRASQFRRLTEPELDRWMGEYSLSELWDMNVFGGRPTPAAAR